MRVRPSQREVRAACRRTRETRDAGAFSVGARVKTKDILDYLLKDELRQLARKLKVEHRASDASYELSEKLARSIGQSYGALGAVPALIDKLTANQVREVLSTFTWYGRRGAYDSKNLGGLPAADAKALLLALHEAEEAEKDTTDEVCTSRRWGEFFSADVSEGDAPDVEDDASNEVSDDALDYRSSKYDQDFKRAVAFNTEFADRELHPYQSDAKSKMLRELEFNPRTPTILHLATGGGKTFTANAIAREFKKGTANKRAVLWITKDWRLLLQAAEDMGRCVKGVRLTRIGGDGGPLHPLRVAEGEDDYRFSDVIYSTIQTMTRRQEDRALLSKIRPRLIVWDECHWGERGRSRRILTACKRMEPAVPIMGLTATPRVQTNYAIGYRKTFKELVDEKHLATPRKVRGVETGIRWTPVIRASEVTSESRKVLADNPARNKTIVEHYVQNSDKYGKTIIFACSIKHAKTLAEKLCERGVVAKAVHSAKLDPGEPTPEAAIADFKRGNTRVLVNMDMLTHGIDVPDALTVFLCRPTASDILFAQMIGRSSRKTETKTHFYIVEFTDNVTTHQQYLKTAKSFFGEAGMSVPFGWTDDAANEEAPTATQSPTQAAQVTPATTSVADLAAIATEEGNRTYLAAMLKTLQSGGSAVTLPAALVLSGWWETTVGNGPTGDILISLQGDAAALDYRLRRLNSNIRGGEHPTTTWAEALSVTPESVYARFTTTVIAQRTTARFVAIHERRDLAQAALAKALEHAAAFEPEMDAAASVPIPTASVGESAQVSEARGSRVFSGSPSNSTGSGAFRAGHWDRQQGPDQAADDPE